MYILIKNLFYVNICTKVFQDSLLRNISIYYFKNSIKSAQNGENVYFAMKNPKCFQCSEASPSPIRAHFVHLTLLGGVSKNGQKWLNPLTKSWIYIKHENQGQGHTHQLI